MMIKRLFLALNVFLVAIFILIGLGTIRSLRKVDTERPPEAIDDHGLLIPEQVAEPLSHYLIIGQRKLFGSLPSPDLEADPTLLEPLPRTELRLRLKGTISGSPSLSRAIIEDLGTRKEALYRLGDMVAGAKIVSIERSQVVIEREGRREVLMIAHEEGMLARRELEEAPLHVHLPPVEPMVVYEEAPLHVHLPPVEPMVRGQMVLGQKEMATAMETADKIMEKLRFDPQNLLDVPSEIIEAVRVANNVLTQARITPHFVGARLEGIRAAKIQPGSIYERLGLRTGDIVKEVNGHRININSIRNAFRIFEELQQQSVITINIERDGHPLSLVYEIR
jgi:general secretion pathway protein C